MTGWEAILSLVWVLLCVLLIIGLAYLFTRYVVGRGGLGAFSAQRQGAIKVKTQLAVGRDRQLLLVQAGGKYLLLGSTATEITKLAEFTPEEAEALEKELAQPTPAPPSFSQALQTALKQRTKR